MARLWHLEHSDGSEWTDAEFGKLADDGTPVFLIGMDGRLWIGEVEWTGEIDEADVPGGQFDQCPDELMEQLDMKVVF